MAIREGIHRSILDYPHQGPVTWKVWRTMGIFNKTVHLFWKTVSFFIGCKDLIFELAQKNATAMEIKCIQNDVIYHGDMQIYMRWHLPCRYGPLARYVKLRVAHAPGMPGTFSPPPRASDPDMHHGTCMTHVPWCMSGSLTHGFLWSRWRGNRSRHSRRMRNLQFYVSGKRPIQAHTGPFSLNKRPYINIISLSPNRGGFELKSFFYHS